MNILSIDFLSTKKAFIHFRNKRKVGRRKNKTNVAFNQKFIYSLLSKGRKIKNRKKLRKEDENETFRWHFIDYTQYYDNVIQMVNW